MDRRERRPYGLCRVSTCGQPHGSHPAWCTPDRSANRATDQVPFQPKSGYRPGPQHRTPNLALTARRRGDRVALQTNGLCTALKVGKVKLMTNREMVRDPRRRWSEV